MSKVWFITGAGKGIGHAIALAALKKGDFVVAATRKENAFSVPDDYKERAINLKLDVSDTELKIYEKAVQTAIDAFGSIDVLVNNAGYGGVTFFEETDEETIKRMFEVNLFGLMRVTRAVLPAMRKQRIGRIFNIASGAGYSAGPVPYHTSKFAVTGFSTSLAFEVENFGINVTNVAPGMFRTNFYDKSSWGIMPDKHIEDYDVYRWQTDFVKDAEKGEQLGDPGKLAEVLVEVAYSANPPLHLPIGEDAPAVLDGMCEKIKTDMEAWRDKVVRTSF